MIPAPLEGAALYADVVTYAELGEHRTGSAADRRTSEWLATELVRAGLQVERLSFPVRRHLLREVLLRVDGEVVPAFPLWPPRSTGFTPVEAPLRPAAPATPSGAIGLARLPASAHPALVGGSPEAECLVRATDGARALVVVTEGESGQIVAWNDEGAPAWPIPVVLVGDASAARLEGAAARGARASLVVDARFDPAARASGVVAELGDGGAAPLVVTTPTSGWFRCGGERGPGVSLLLGLARAAAARARPGRFVFAALPGHELGGLGLDAFLDEHAPGPAVTRAWLHLGAALATRRWRAGPRGRLRPDGLEPRRSLVASPGLRSLVAEAVGDALGLVPAMRGEPSWDRIAARGYEGFAMGGTHRFQHTPGDEARTTAPELLAPLAAALWRALAALEARGATPPPAGPL